MKKSKVLSSTKVQSKAKGPTIADVANEAKVGVMTVSRTINNPESVSDVLRTKVLEAIDKLGYQPSKLASSLSQGATQLVPIVVPTLHHSVYVPFLDGACEILCNKGYQILLGVTDYREEKEDKLIASLLEWRPAGILLAGVDHSPRVRELLKKADTAIVEYMDLSTESDFDNVGFSHYEVGQAVANFYADKGHKHIAYVGNALARDPKTVKRVSGFQNALKKRGLPSNLIFAADAGFSVELGGFLLTELLAQHPQTEAVFFSNDDLAAGAIFECLRRGLKVPQDISIMGFNDLEIAAQMVPSITTVATPRMAMGEKAADILLQRLNNPDGTREVINMGFRIIERESTR